MNELSLLYVEDDPETAEAVLYFINRYFKNIYLADDGEKALNYFKTYSPDIILLDINIPKINGISFAKRIRELDITKPIIFLTACSETEKLLSAIELGAISYLIKPFKIEKLQKSLQKSINFINIKKESNFIHMENNFMWMKKEKALYYKNNNIKLTKNEILITEYLLLNRGNFFNALSILEDLFYDSKSLHNSNNIVQLISRFKHKIYKKIDKKIFFIENLYGEGYRIK